MVARTQPKAPTMKNLIKNQRREKLLRAMAAQYRMQKLSPFSHRNLVQNKQRLLPLRYAVAARILELHPEAINMTWGEAVESGLTKL